MTYSLIVLSFFLMASRPGFAQAAADIPIAPDAALQAKIDTAVRAAVRGGATRVQRFAEVEKLRSAWEADPLVFSRQLLYYMANAPDVSEAMAADGIFIHFNADKNTAVDAILPYIEPHASRAPRFREAVQLVLGWLEGTAGGETPPHFGCYTAVLRRNLESPPPALVRYMFQRDPSQALRQFTEVYRLPSVQGHTAGREELRWADHVVNDVIKNGKFLSVFSKAPGGARDAVVTLERLTREEATFQLEKLSKSDDWWVRLYVAETLRQHPAFRTPEVLERLAADKHPLVREAMTFATGKAKAPPKPPAGKAPSPPAKLEIREEPDKEPPIRP